MQFRPFQGSFPFLVLFWKRWICEVAWFSVTYGQEVISNKEESVLMCPLVSRISVAFHDEILPPQS